MSFGVDDPRFDQQPPESLPEQREPRQGRGCLFWGCLITAILMLLLLVGVPLAIYFAARHYINQFTAEEPAKIEVVELPAARVEQITARFDAFAKAIREDGAPPDFEITAEELNGLINENKDLAGKVFLRIEDGRVGGDLSLPTDELPGGGGRFFNASVDFEVAMRDGALTVSLADAKVNGTPLPKTVLDAFAGQNLAKDLRTDPKTAEVLSKFESLEVVGDKIILRPRRDLPAAGDTDGKDDAEVKGEIETFDEDTAPVAN